MGRWRERKGVRGMGRWTERTRRERMKPERRGEREGQQGGLEGESRQRIRRRRVPNEIPFYEPTPGSC